MSAENGNIDAVLNRFSYDQLTSLARRLEINLTELDTVPSIKSKLLMRSPIELNLAIKEQVSEQLIYESGNRQRVTAFLNGLELHELKTLSEQVGLSIPGCSRREPYIEKLLEEKETELQHHSMAAPFWTLQQQVGSIRSDLSGIKEDYDSRLVPVDFIRGLFRTYQSTVLTILAFAAFIGIPVGNELWTVHTASNLAKEASPKIEEAMQMVDKLNALTLNYQTQQIQIVSVLARQLQNDQVEHLSRILKDFDAYNVSELAIEDIHYLKHNEALISEFAKHIENSRSDLEEKKENDTDYSEEDAITLNDLKSLQLLIETISGTAESLEELATLFNRQSEYEVSDLEKLSKLRKEWTDLVDKYMEQEIEGKFDRVAAQRMRIYSMYLSGILELEEYRRGASKGDPFHLAQAYKSLGAATDMDSEFALPRIYQITTLRLKIKNEKQNQEALVDEARQLHAESVELCKVQKNKAKLVRAHNNFAYLLIDIAKQKVNSSAEDARRHADEAKDVIDTATKTNDPNPIIYTTEADLYLLYFKLEDDPKSQAKHADKVVELISKAVDAGFRGYSRYGLTKLLSDDLYGPIKDHSPEYKANLIKALNFQTEPALK